jgi:uncharacterized coiled-coil DUF342 family protein
MHVDPDSPSTFWGKITVVVGGLITLVGTVTAAIKKWPRSEARVTLRDLRDELRVQDVSKLLKLDTLATECKNTSAAIQVLSSRLDGLEKRVATHDRKQDEMSSKINEISVSVGRLEGKYDQAELDKHRATRR